MKAETALHHGHHCFVEIGIVVDHDRVLPSHFGNHSFHHPATRGRRFRSQRVDRKAHGPRARKGHDGCIGVRHKNRTDHLAASWHKVDRLCGHASLTHDLIQLIGHERRLLCRLHHHRVAGYQGRGGHACQNRQWKIPRCNHNGHSSRQRVGGVLLARRVHLLRASQPQCLAGVVVAKVDRLGHIGIRFSPRLAHLKHLHSRQIKPPLPHDQGGCSQTFRPPLYRHGPPCWCSIPGSNYSAAGCFGRCVADMRNQRGVVRGIMAGKSVGRFLADAVNHNRHKRWPRTNTLASGSQDSSKHLSLRVRVRKIGERFVEKRCCHRQRRLLLGDKRLPGRSQQRCSRHVLHKTSPQKRIVGRIFEQSPHQIRHPGHQLAVGHVHSHPPTGSRHRMFFRIPHAVEHLHFDRAFVEAQVLGHGHAVCQRSQIVACKRRPKQRRVFEQKRCGSFEAGVRLPFLSPHRHRPASSPRVDCFVVPVGSLHQPHPDWRAATACPLGQRFQIPQRVAEVGLHHNAAVRPIPKLLLHRNPLKDGERQSFGGMTLHVDVHLRPLRLRQSPQRTQPGKHAVGRAPGIDCIKLAVERRQLQRHIHSRQRSCRAIVDNSIGRPASRNAGQFLQ